MRQHAREHGSMSSETSLTGSESDVLSTPPDSPGFNSSPSSTSTSPDSTDDKAVNPMDATPPDHADLARLSLAQAAEDDRRTPLAVAHPQAKIWQEESHGAPAFTITPTSPPPTHKDKGRKLGLRMDLSALRDSAMNAQIDTAPPPGAPKLGCISTPDAYTTTFATPRPGPVSRFSDDTPLDTLSSYAEEDHFELASPGLTDGSSLASTPDTAFSPASTTSAASIASTSPKRIKAPPKPLTIPSVNAAVVASSPGPFTPRTVSAFDCFGISSGPAKPLLNRRTSASRSSPTMSAYSPTNARCLPRSPLAMPPAMSMAAQQQQAATKMSRLSSQDSALSIDEAKKLYHALLPGEKSRFGDLLSTPDRTQDTPAAETSTDVNPYFVESA